jgi:hypothetical protein
MSNNKAFFVQRLNDHIQYLGKVTNTLKGADNFQGTNCHQCKLGTWIDSEGKHTIAQLTSDAQAQFHELMEKHELFHDHSNAALLKHKAGDHLGSRRAMTEMHKLSGQLVNLLLDLDRKARKHAA